MYDPAMLVPWADMPQDLDPLDDSEQILDMLVEAVQRRFPDYSGRLEIGFPDMRSSLHPDQYPILVRVGETRELDYPFPGVDVIGNSIANEIGNMMEAGWLRLRWQRHHHRRF